MRLVGCRLRAAGRYPRVPVRLAAPWTMPLADALRPPMEQGRRADEVRARLQPNAARGLGILQRLDAGEVPIDQHGIRQWPQMLRRLQFRGVWRQEQQVDMLGHSHLETGVPASAVEHEHDLFGRTGTD